MSDTRYSVRDHDAEWLLQRERLHSDGILQKQRRSQKPKKRSTNIAAPRRLTPLTPAQRRTAAERLRDTAAQLGAPAAELQQVFDMLGLGGADLKTTYTELGHRRVPNGSCATCGRPSIAIRLDRTLVSHTPRPGMKLNDSTRCQGSGQLAETVHRIAAAPASAKRVKPQRRTPGDHQENPLPTRAACQDEDPELFFPAGYSETYAREIEKAVGVCGRCPLSAACLRYALDQGEIEHGIYGGTTPEQRRQLLSRRAAA